MNAMGITNTNMAAGASGAGGYYVDTAGKNTKRIAEYIANQMKEDQISDQISMKEYMSPLRSV